MSSMPEQKPGRSKQDWQTPESFVKAVEARLGSRFVWDLAASHDNCVTAQFFDEEMDALTRSWQGLRDCDDPNHWLWLNPPYADISPWVEKCATESARGAHIACLVPASVGANWWRDWVVPHGYILFLNGRLTFVGADAPYPKDLALILYTPFIRSGSATWNWREQVAR